MNWRGLLNPVSLLSEVFPARGESDREFSDLTLLRSSRRAMATVFEIILPFGNRRSTAAAGLALDLIDELEDQLSAFRAHSEIVRLNERAASEAVQVEPGLFCLLTVAAAISRDTQGAFDVATGALTKAWGFYQRAGRVPTVAERAAAISRSGMRHVILEAKTQAVRYLREGLEINLGGIGKGYALDRAAELLRQNGMSSGLLHGGMSSVLAIGAPPNDSRGWMVSLRHPWTENRSVGTVYLRDRALGTSAATYQFFEYNGRKLGHILNPRNGWPAEGPQQVSVIANTAAESDALSTALYVLGLDGAREYCRTHPHIAAVVLPANDDVPVLLNLAPDEFSPAPL